MGRSGNGQCFFRRRITIRIKIAATIAAAKVGMKAALQFVGSMGCGYFFHQITVIMAGRNLTVTGLPGIQIFDLGCGSFILEMVAAVTLVIVLPAVGTGLAVCTLAILLDGGVGCRDLTVAALPGSQLGDLNSAGCVSIQLSAVGVRTLVMILPTVVRTGCCLSVHLGGVGTGVDVGSRSHRDDGRNTGVFAGVHVFPTCIIYIIVIQTNGIIAGYRIFIHFALESHYLDFTFNCQCAFHVHNYDYVCAVLIGTFIILAICANSCSKICVKRTGIRNISQSLRDCKCCLPTGCYILQCLNIHCKGYDVICCGSLRG